MHRYLGAFSSICIYCIFPGSVYSTKYFTCKCSIANWSVVMLTWPSYDNFVGLYTVNHIQLHMNVNPYYHSSLFNNMKTKNMLCSLKITKESFNHSKSQQRNHMHPLQGVLLYDSAVFALYMVYCIICRVTAQCILDNTQCCPFHCGSFLPPVFQQLHTKKIHCHNSI